MRNERQLRTFITTARPKFEDLLGQMVEVPSISMDSSHKGDIRRVADLAVQYLVEMGAKAQVVETGGYPIVSGGWTAGAEYPTVTIYNHLDVQPAEEPEWKHPPFAFRNTHGLYQGRGATDDKGPALTALFGARYVIEQGVPINIRFLWELEEEIGSPHFSVGLRDRTAVTKPDSVIVSDTIWISKNRPAVPYGLRGLLGARLTLRTGEKDAHSGCARNRSCA
jgi:acetylornithine deacetylase/succinyl-diaminopimelate desuccinylase-like protein